MDRLIPNKYRKLYYKARSGKSSRKAAIRSFCLECVGYIEKEVELCTDEGCPLFNFRLTG